jgi:hypothetical protein
MNEEKKCARIEYTKKEYDYCDVEEKDLKKFAKEKGRPEADFLDDDLLKEYVQDKIDYKCIGIGTVDFPD